MTQKAFASLIVFTFAFAFVSNTQAHDVFQDVLKEKYTLKSFSCKTCHPDSDNRKLRTPFADRIFQVMKDKNYSAQFDIAVKADEETEKKAPLPKGEGKVAEFDKMIAKEFEKVWPKVAEQKMSFDDMFKQGLMNGARLDTKKIAKAAEEKKATEEKK